MHHGVRIQDAALVAAAVLSDRYITGRFLPDKAIDLVDEAARRLRIEIDSMPTEIDVVERRIRQLEIERVALAKETDDASQGAARRARRASWPTCSEQRDGDEGALAGREGRHRRRSATLQGAARAGATDAEQAEREGDLERAAEIRYGADPRARAPRSTRPPSGSTELQADAADAEGGGRRGGHRRGRRASGPASPSAG